MFKYLILGNALTLSAVAAYYSIFGLTIIFSAAAIPVAVMGVALEVAKLSAATFLHNHWNKIGIILKSYLSFAVAVLMLITSLGIFGLLSKANIDANLEVKQSQQIINQLDQQIEKLQSEQLLSQQRASDMNNKSQLRGDDEIDLLKEQLKQTQEQATALNDAVTSQNIIKIQSIAGVKADGNYGPATENAVAAFRSSTETKISELTDRIQTINDRIQENVTIVEIIDNTDEIRLLTQERFEKEKIILKLESEIGPIKYISELLYESSEEKTMEEAVRWMIIIIVIVFDPLAISLLLVFNALNTKEKHTKKSKKNRKQKDDVEEPIQQVPPNIDVKKPRGLLSRKRKGFLVK